MGDNAGEFVRQLMSDAVFYASLNFVGLYVRYVGEINMRRGFLDKRGCIETTFKLKYEKEQEVSTEDEGRFFVNVHRLFP